MEIQNILGKVYLVIYYESKLIFISGLLMKLITILMVLLLLLLQYRLWTGNGSLVEVSLLKDEIEKIKSENQRLKERNLSLTAEVFNLKQGNEAIEEIARSEMGMIKDGETFYQIIESTDQESNPN